jgi:predicted nucleic acid-binding protein
MSGVVIDTSVVIKRLIREELSEHARALFHENLRGGQRLLAPPLLPSEVTNALFQRTRRQQNNIGAGDAEQALALFLRLPIQLVSPEGLYPRAFAFARANRLRATYDSLYVVLALLLGVDCWTADQGLLNNLGPTAPWVRWIGDYPIS